MIEAGDFEERDAVGSIDRIVTNFGMALMAVLPTFVIGLAMPWKLGGLITGDDRDGRQGAILAPGVFFLLCLTVFMLMIALAINDDIAAVNEAFIGPQLARNVADAVGEGDVWKVLSVIAPIYGVAIATGLGTLALRPFAGPYWNVRASFRTAMYTVAIIVSYIGLTSLVIDAVATSRAEYDLSRSLYAGNNAIIAVVVVWLSAGFHRAMGAIAVWRAGLLGLLTLGIYVGMMMLITMVPGG